MTFIEKNHQCCGSTSLNILNLSGNKLDFMIAHVGKILESGAPCSSCVYRRISLGGSNLSNFFYAKSPILKEFGLSGNTW
ncbi:hypothetical protein Mapa_016301 [Marchantia paleacea]|nr:hypothetical protein Mapa_016301 [Marchantia paleacea]